MLRYPPFYSSVECLTISTLVWLFYYVAGVVFPYRNMREKDLILIGLNFMCLYRSFLPAISANKPGTPPHSLDPSKASQSLPMYLPTTFNPTAYHTIEIRKKISITPPSPPPKDPKLIEMEVCNILYAVNVTHTLYIHIIYFQNQLYSSLVTFRNNIAHDAGIPPFMIASNKLLADLTAIR